MFHSTHSPTVSSTLKSLSTVYREQGREETAKELEQLTKEKVGRAEARVAWLWYTGLMCWSITGVGPGTAG